VTALDRLRRHEGIARLERTLASQKAVEVNDPTARRAAVAILIRLGENDEPEILFIQRAVYEGDPWSGHIAFPGGREEPGDESPLGTVFRETFEETQLDLRETAHLLGVLDDLRPRTATLPAMVVRPFVFLVAESREPVLSLEVAASFWVPLTNLFDRSVWDETTVVAGDVEMSRVAFHHRGFVIWGMTEKILSHLLEILGS
jgi:8-oxo-dGTP pyrophosphatase MutT (NUDIX family)